MTKSRSPQREPRRGGAAADHERADDEAEQRRRAPGRRASRRSSKTSVTSIVSPSATNTAISARLASDVWKRSISRLVRRARVADQQAGDEDGQEARAVQRPCDAVDDARSGEHPERVQRPVRQASACASPAGARPRRRRRRRSRPPSRQRTRATTVQKLAVVARRELDHADHQRDPDRVVRAGLALEDRARAPADLAAAEDGEHHGRVGRRERGAEEAARSSSEKPSSGVRGDRDEAGRRERAEDAERRRSARRPRGTRRQPTCMPPSKRITISATTPIRSTVRDRDRVGERREEVRRDRRREQEQRRRRDREARGRSSRPRSASEKPAGDDEDDRPEGGDLVQGGQSRLADGGVRRLHFLTDRSPSAHSEPPILRSHAANGLALLLVLAFVAAVAAAARARSRRRRRRGGRSVATAAARSTLFRHAASSSAGSTRAASTITDLTPDDSAADSSGATTSPGRSPRGGVTWCGKSVRFRLIGGRYRASSRHAASTSRPSGSAGHDRHDRRRPARCYSLDGDDCRSPRRVQAAAPSS